MEARKRQIVFAVIIAFVALLLNKFYVDSVRDQYKPKRLETVVRVSRNLQAGTPLVKDDLEPVKVPSEFKPRLAIAPSDIDGFLGQNLAVDVLAGDYLLESYFAVRRSVAQSLSGQVTEPGYRAVTIPVNSTTSMAGSIVPGDHIDILFTFPVPDTPEKMTVVLMQGIKVIATGEYSAEDREVGRHKQRRDAQYSSMTLLMSAEDAVKLSYAQQIGRIDVLLRSESDEGDVASLTISGVDDLLSDADKRALKKTIKSYEMSEEEREKLHKHLQRLYQQQGGRGRVPGE